MRRLLAAALACAGCVLLLAPALALARPAGARAKNTRATRAYLRAATTYARSISTALDASVAAIEARGSAIGAECPAALTYAPRDEAFEAIAEEASRTLSDAGAEPTVDARRAFAHAVSRLRWSNRRLATLVREQATEELAPATAALPDVCADIDTWQASAYAALPQSTERFLHAGGGELGSFLVRLLALFEEPRRVKIAHLLARFENGRERQAAMRIEVQEEQASDRLHVVNRIVGQKLAAELGITAL